MEVMLLSRKKCAPVRKMHSTMFKTTSFFDDTDYSIQYILFQLFSILHLGFKQICLNCHPLTELLCQGQYENINTSDFFKKYFHCTCFPDPNDFQGVPTLSHVLQNGI